MKKSPMKPETLAAMMQTIFALQVSSQLAESILDEKKSPPLLIDMKATVTNGESADLNTFHKETTGFHCFTLTFGAELK